MRDPYLIDPDWPWRKRLRCRLWNATVVRHEVSSRAYMRGEADVPRRYGFAYNPPHRATRIYMLRPFHLIARLWHWYMAQRWCIERALIDAGVLTLMEGEYYYEARWSFPKWWADNRRGMPNPSWYKPPPRFWFWFWRTC